MIGAAGITLGLWPLLDKTPLIILTEAPDYLSDNKTPELQVNLKVGIILLVSIGSILIIMGIGGCVGVFKRISWMLCLVSCLFTISTYITVNTIGTQGPFIDLVRGLVCVHDPENYVSGRFNLY